MSCDQGYGGWYRSGSDCKCTKKKTCAKTEYQAYGPNILGGGSTTTDRICATCSTCKVGLKVTTSCERGEMNTKCTTCTGCKPDHYAPRGPNNKIQTEGGCAFDTGSKVVPNADFICSPCKLCSADRYRESGCSSLDKFATDATCGVCEQCPKGEFRSGGCSGEVNSICTTCTPCDPGEYRSSGCAGTTNSVCTRCPTGTFALTTTSTACEGILIKDIRIKQFDATKKFPVWKPVPAGPMSQFEESMYAEEAVISFQMPIDDWTEIRVYCGTGVDPDISRCDTWDTDVVATYDQSDGTGRYYFVCTKTDIYDATRECECNGVAGFAASGSHEDCGPWDGLTQCLVQDGNCKDPITGNAPVRAACEFGTITETISGVAAVGSCCPGPARALGQGTCSDSHPNMYSLTGFVCWTGEGDNVGKCTPPAAGKDRWKSQCNPNAPPRDSARTCYADPASQGNIYVRLPGLQGNKKEYKFQIVPKHSTAVSLSSSSSSLFDLYSWIIFDNF